MSGHGDSQEEGEHEPGGEDNWGFLPWRPLLLAYIFACKMGTWGSGPVAGMGSPVWACRDEGCGLPLTWRSPDAAEVKPQAQEEVRL